VTFRRSFRIAIQISESSGLENQPPPGLSSRRCASTFSSPDPDPCDQGSGRGSPDHRSTRPGDASGKLPKSNITLWNIQRPRAIDRQSGCRLTTVFRAHHGGVYAETKADHTPGDLKRIKEIDAKFQATEGWLHPTLSKLARERELLVEQANKQFDAGLKHEWR
jgi:hypothetical protein